MMRVIMPQFIKTALDGPFALPEATFSKAERQTYDASRVRLGEVGRSLINSLKDIRLGWPSGTFNRISL